MVVVEARSGLDSETASVVAFAWNFYIFEHSWSPVYTEGLQLGELATLGKPARRQGQPADGDRYSVLGGICFTPACTSFSGGNRTKRLGAANGLLERDYGW